MGPIIVLLGTDFAGTYPHRRAPRLRQRTEEGAWRAEAVFCVWCAGVRFRSVGKHDDVRRSLEEEDNARKLGRTKLSYYSSKEEIVGVRIDSKEM
jgi:hypothetical protein